MKQFWNSLTAFLNKIPSHSQFVTAVVLAIFIGVTASQVLSILIGQAKFIFNHTLTIVESTSLLAADMAAPKKFEPVARFTANMNWETNTITLDGSTSKTYDGKVAKYVWRIDDGSSDAESATIEHTFNHPGYYLVRLSVIDSNEQVDSATCQLFIPPTEIEPIESRRTETAANATTERTTIESEWAPVGTFYNYTKMSNTSNAALRSRFVESGCGFSNQNFNAAGNAIDKDKVNDIISSTVALLVNTLFLLVLFFVGKRIVAFLHKKLSEVKQK